MALPPDNNTFSFDDNFVLVLSSEPKLTVQVLDETHAASNARRTLLKKIVLTLAIGAKGIQTLVRLYLKGS